MSFTNNMSEYLSLTERFVSRILSGRDFDSSFGKLWEKDRDEEWERRQVARNAPDNKYKLQASEIYEGEQ